MTEHETKNPKPETRQHETPEEYSPRLKDIIARLTRAQERTAMGDEAFAKKHLPYSSTVWFRLKDGTYPPTQSPDKLAARLEVALRKFNARRQGRSVVLDGQKIHTFEHCERVFNAIDLARAATNENRGVLYLAPTGGGKSTLLRAIADKYESVLVEARESWRKSYYFALVDIATALEIPGCETLRGEHDAECAVISRLQEKQLVMCIDEGEYFGPRTINLLKLILNQSRTVIVLAAIPELFQRMSMSAWVESRQFCRRLQEVVKLSVISPDEVKEFITTPLEKPRETCVKIASEANIFGHFDLVKRTADLLVQEHPKGASHDDAMLVLQSARQMLKGA